MDAASVRKMLAINDAFRPGAPIDSQELFAGRRELVQDLIRAVGQRGRHAILYGERGVGKTSLANILADILRGAGWEGLGSGTINADPTDTFSSLFHKVFRDIHRTATVRRVGFRRGEDAEPSGTLADWLPEVVTPDDVRAALQYWGQPTIIIIDELDRLQDPRATSLLSDTVKNLSDHAVDTTLILVGVADSVDQLIAEHQSVERALVQVRMPRMSVVELHEIIDRGMERVTLAIEPNAKNDIARLSQGLPHYTHLLAHHAAIEAVSEGRSTVTGEDVTTATDAAVTKAQQSIISAYHKATISPQKGTLYAEVLLACALAQTDDVGSFAAADVRAPLSKILGKPVEIPSFSRHLKDFSEARRGPILLKRGEKRRNRFRFVNPLMQPFVIMHGIAKGLYQLPIEPPADTAKKGSTRRDSNDPAQQALPL